MCVVSIALLQHPDFPFVLCSNRDEFPDRTSTPAALHPDGILCGIDTKSNGTWIGFNTKTGRFAVVTNCGGRVDGLSRGVLVNKFLNGAGPMSVEEFKSFNGFNLMWGNLFGYVPEVLYATNQDPAPGRGVVTLRAGVHTIANDRLGDEFVKVPHISEGVADILAKFISTAQSTDTEQQPSTPGEQMTANARKQQRKSRHTQQANRRQSQANAHLMESVHALRDQLGSFMLNPSNPLPFWATIAKYFFFSQRYGRRVQPGLRVTANFSALMLVLLALPTAFGFLSISTWLLTSLLLGFSLGIRYHIGLQRLRVSLWPLSPYRTVSQTVILLSRLGNVHYFYREVPARPAPPSPWRCFEPLFPMTQ